MEETSNSEEKIVLIYDGECPICCRYSAYVRLRQKMNLELTNAREAPDMVADLKGRGYDLNQGMALLWGERVYLGRDALLVIDGLTYAQGFWDAPLRLMLRIPGFARVVYPICKAVRWIALKLLGKNPDLHAVN